MPASHGCAGERGGRRPETFRGGSRGPTDGRLRMGGAMGISAAVARRRHFPGKKTWGKSHLAWIASQKIDHLEQRIAFEELMLAMRQARERIERLEQAMRESMSAWSLAPVVEALQAVRGGLSGILCARPVDHHALTNLSWNMMANWVFASHHSRGGIFHSPAT